MAKNSIRDYSATNSSNTDIQSIDISEGCSPAGINNAIREIMADLKDVSTGAVALESPAFDSASLTGDLTFGDSDKCIFGAGSDLQIYHDGSHSYVQDAGQGRLYLRASDGIKFDNTDSSKTGLSVFPDSAVYAYYNGSLKLATTATGCDITGTVTATTFQANAGGTFTTASGNDLNIVYPANRSLFIKEDTQTHVTVDNTGKVGIGVTPIVQLDVKASTELAGFQHTSGTGTIRFYNTSKSTTGYIQWNNSTVSYVTGSDYRLKTAVNYDWDATTRLKQLRPARFEWIADGDDAVPVDGFLAHEVQDIVPEAISGTKDAMRDEEYEVTPAVLDEDGNEVTPAVMGTRSVPDYQGIDQGKLVPLLVKSLQEALTEIDSLKARLDDAGL